MLKMPPSNVPTPSARRPRVRSDFSITLPVISLSARNMPRDSIITTTITMHMVAMGTRWNCGQPKWNGMISANHFALAILS